MESLREMELLKTIVKQSESKPPGYYVTITGRKSEIITSFSPPLSFPNDHVFEMACCSVETFYSFPNIDKTNNSMRISLDGGKKWLVIEIPTGSYEIRAINSAVKKLIEKKRLGNTSIGGDYESTSGGGGGRRRRPMQR